MFDRAEFPDLFRRRPFSPLQKKNLAIVGRGFGTEFIPIYYAPPNINPLAVCQRDAEKIASLQATSASRMATPSMTNSCATPASSFE